MMKKHIFLTIALLVGAIVFCNHSFSQTEIQTKHQIGIKASDIINALIKSPRYGLDLNYRLKLSQKTHFRSGLSFFSRIENNENSLSSGASLGIDWVIKDYAKWHFYWGVDLIGFYNTNELSQRSSYQASLAPFLGIMVNFSPHFSLTTEPHFYLSFLNQIDNGSITGRVSEKGFEFGLEQIGTFGVNFHF